MGYYRSAQVTHKKPRPTLTINRMYGKDKAIQKATRTVIGNIILDLCKTTYVPLNTNIPPFHTHQIILTSTHNHITHKGISLKTTPFPKFATCSNSNFAPLLLSAEKAYITLKTFPRKKQNSPLLRCCNLLMKELL